MKIALCQINPTIGDFDGNCARIERMARNAAELGADLAVFSEQCILGYPARDLVERPSFIAAHNRALERLCGSLSGTLAVIVGGIRRSPKAETKPLTNACFLLHKGAVIAAGDKCLLPTYDVFDEDRYFEPGAQPVCVEFAGKKLGLTICEDCWNDKNFWKQRSYPFDPVENLVGRGCDILINISASPFNLGKAEIRRNMLSTIAREYRRPLIYVNQVGGNDDLIFDGRSIAFDAEGNILAAAPAFEESMVIADIGARGAAQFPGDLPVEEDVRRALVLGTRDYARKCGFKTAVLGLSGGIDSALVAALAAEAFGPENVTGVAMPSRFNADQSLIDARESAQNLGIHFAVIPIEDLAGAYKTALAPAFAGRKEDVTEENLQARIRGVLLMALSNKFGHLLLTTGNKSELATGYCTLYGDMCGGLAVISDLYKGMVYRLSRYLNATAQGKLPIPVSSIEKEPSAELRPGQRDQDSLPPYPVLDEILKAVIEEQHSAEDLIAKGFDPATVKRVLRLIDITEYKRRQAAPGLKVTAKAFGTGRRIPIAQRIFGS